MATSYFKAHLWEIVGICAGSRSYEFYWDSVQHGRLWTKLPELHAKLGPIVRIGPDELHIQDLGYFTYLFSFKPLDKWAIAARQIGLRYAMFGTEEYKQYTQRRAAFGDAFSRSKTFKLQPLVNANIRKGCQHIEARAAQNQTTDLAYLYRATTAEILTKYMYGQNYSFFVDEKTTRGLYDRRFDKIFGLTNLGRFIPYMIPTISILIRSRINLLLGSHGTTTSILGFKGSDKTGDALSQATMAAWSGGWDTTAFALTQCSYYLMKHPRVLNRLQQELIAVWPDAAEDPTYSMLISLPYLDAVIKESLRLMYGALSRLTRNQSVRKRAVPRVDYSGGHQDKHVTTRYQPR
ncbi:hypothetical protein DOTSEDRAFT_79897 [Dothistroma septosporum NZE10]|uniref:Uncharacterized protein n=1 Tax=Dothistroma septosporum (strain NZE10 / CBS 128990) TaxID=675120 RepID=N1PKV8_DOTSN|nr:hypothetical protein DOTSEDRAFT_79897 [Dothistroma septosporum NZE10]